MTIFHLPDLGEGLPDAEIHQWFVQVGDHIEADQPLVSMETAKALVDVPAPQAGKVLELFGQPGDVIATGSPLMRFEEDTDLVQDQGTVVGKLEEHTTATETMCVAGSAHASAQIRCTPKIRLLAKQHGLRLEEIVGSGPGGLITQQDIDAALQTHTEAFLEASYEPLKGVRRAMVKSMIASHEHIVPVTIYDEVDIHHWTEETDLTIELIKALVKACHAEPALNAWYHEAAMARQCFEDVHIGLAMDSEEGLFVPVLHDVAKKNDVQLRQTINQYKQALKDRSLPPDTFKGATLTLSNFGKFAGRFASPIIVPPMVAILAVGRKYLAPVVHHKQVIAHPVLPLSLTFDHRAVTGGEATRFLGALMQALQA
jgi:2-oxoisovalerate dehydrogenase E2 component (dihydrolipoyl transacylase)